MTIRTADGRCSKIARMVHRGQPDSTAAQDLAQELHSLAEQYQFATGEQDYGNCVRAILRMNSDLAAAYRAYTSDKGIALPLRASNDDAPKEHRVDEAVLELAKDMMRRTGIKSLSEAARRVLAEDKQLARRYSRFTSTA